MAIVLEKVRGESDFAFVSQVLSDPVATEMNMGRPFTLEEITAYFGYMMDYNADHEQSGFFVIREAESGKQAGICLLYLMGDEAQVEYMLLPAFWNKGYATEAVKALLQIAARCGVHHVMGMMDPENVPSRKVLQKNGFVYENMAVNDDDFSLIAIYGIML